MICASCNEATMLIANSDKPKTTRHEVGIALDALLEGLQFQSQADEK
ncbi:MAG: hypothetical protein ABW199_12375 [Caulobacterales bacterium]